MSAQHTEGRLRAGMNGAMAQDTPQVYLFTDEQFGTLVASLKTAPMSPTAEADARRLAACWNMLADFSTEQTTSSSFVGHGLISIPACAAKTATTSGKPLQMNCSKHLHAQPLQR